MHIFTRQGKWVAPWNASDIYIMSKKGIRSVNATKDSGRWLEGLVLTACFMIWWTGDLLQSSTAVALWVPRCLSLVARSHHLLQMPTRIPPKNFSTVGSFFTCRWQAYLSSWDYSSRFARNICCQPTLTARIRCCERKKFRREMLPKKQAGSSYSRMNKYFFITRRPATFTKKFIVLFALEKFFLLNESTLQQWARLTTQKTLHSSKVCWYLLAIFRSLIYEISCSLRKVFASLTRPKLFQLRLMLKIDAGCCRRLFSFTQNETSFCSAGACVSTILLIKNT